jgi:azurin
MKFNTKPSMKPSMKLGLKVLASCILATSLVAGAASAKTCDITVEASDAMAYNTKSLSFAGCSEVKLTLKHTGKLPKAAMGHNLVIAAEAKVKDVMAASMKSGPAKDYAADAKDIIATTKLLGGGESDTITFATSKFKKGTKYKFLCTFPGHGSIMVGDVAI